MDSETIRLRQMMNGYASIAAVREGRDKNVPRVNREWGQ